MNNLSWFLYLADTIPQMSVVCLLITIFLFAAWASWGISYGDGLTEVPPPNTKFILAIVLLVVVFVLVPSKQTIYLIAGSEAGEYVVTSPEGQEIINDIKAIIKSQIEELK